MLCTLCPKGWSAGAGLDDRTSNLLLVGEAQAGFHRVWGTSQRSGSRSALAQWVPRVSFDDEQCPAVYLVKRVDTEYLAVRGMPIVRPAQDHRRSIPRASGPKESG